MSRIIDKCDVDYPWDALHIFAENSRALKHNMLMLNLISSKTYNVPAIDHIPSNTPHHEIVRIRNANQSQTCGFSSNLLLKIGARVMLTSNIEISDRVINGKSGTTTKFHFVTNGTINKIYVRFDDPLAGAKSLPSGRNDEEHNPVASEKLKAT